MDQYYKIISMKSIIILIITIITSLNLTCYAMHKKSNAYRRGSYYKLSETYINKNLPVPIYIIVELDKRDRRKALQHNYECYYLIELNRLLLEQ